MLTITVLTVLVVSGLCSLFEAVLYAIPASHVEHMASEGSIIGRRLKALRENVDQPITAILSLNTIANTAGASLAGALAAEQMHGNELLAFSGIFTLAILLLSEVIPKTIGVVYARPLAGLVALPLTLLVVVFRPVIAVIGLVTKVIRGAGGTGVMSDAEIATMARLGEEQGVLDQSEAAVIQNILELEDKTVAQVMTPRTVVYRLESETTVEEAAQDDHIMQHSRIPVQGDRPDEIIGVVFRRQILRQAVLGDGTTQVSELMNPPQFLRETVKLNVALRMALRSQSHMFIVVDQFAGFAGVVTLEDIIEEILGAEIVDESDVVADLREIAEMKRRALMAEGRSPSVPPVVNSDPEPDAS